MSSKLEVRKMDAMEDAYNTMRDALICILSQGDRHSSWTARKALNSVRSRMSKVA